MLAQDSLGYVHEVPDFQVGYGLAEYPDGSVAEVPMALDGYGGYGSPMGLPFLAPIASALAPMAAKFLPQAAQGISRLVGGLMPGAMNAIRGAGQLVGSGINAFRGGLQQGGMMPTPFGPRPMPAMPGMPMPMPMPGMPRPFFRAPSPVGWVTPALPFTGTRPRRMYLRCAAWPGPSGMVPAFANQALPLPGMPGMPGMPGAPGMPAVPGGRRRRRRGRR